MLRISAKVPTNYNKILLYIIKSVSSKMIYSKSLNDEKKDIYTLYCDLFSCVVIEATAHNIHDTENNLTCCCVNISQYRYHRYHHISQPYSLVWQRSNFLFCFLVFFLSLGSIVGESWQFHTHQQPEVQQSITGTSMAFLSSVVPVTIRL